MWSLIQRHQIRAHVKRELAQTPKSTDKPSATDPSDLESARHPSVNPSGKDWPNGVPSSDEEQQSSSAKEQQHILVKSEPGDPLNPQNWPLISRCKNIAVLSILIFVQGWAGASESMANSVASSKFHVSRTAQNLDTAMYLFGIGTGAPFTGPLSETVGRNPVYLGATFCYLFFVFGSAMATTFGGRITCRYFVGLFSSATLGINGSSVRDQFRDVKRAFVFPIIAWANVIGKLTVSPHTKSINKTLMFFFEQRPFSCSCSKRMAGIQSKLGLALARLDDFDYIRCRIHYCGAVSSRNILATASGLESKRTSTCNRRCAVHVRTRNGSQFLQSPETQCETWYYLLPNRNHRNGVGVLPITVIHTALHFPLRF